MPAAQVEFDTYLWSIGRIQSGMLSGAALVAGSYGVVGAEVNFTANADAVTFTTVTGQQYLASSLGAALTFSAGDNAEIVEIVAF